MEQNYDNDGENENDERKSFLMVNQNENNAE